MLRQLAIYERSYCSCEKCKSICKTKPGALAPADIDNIAEFLGEEYASKEFCETYFDVDRSGSIPVLRPTKKEDGTCIFLDTNEACTIHKVAPFECTRCNACDFAAGDAARAALQSCIAGSMDYKMLVELQP